jgi:hypothetical protein
MEIIKNILAVIGGLVVLLTGLVTIACCINSGKIGREFEEQYWQDKDD